MKRQRWAGGVLLGIGGVGLAVFFQQHLENPEGLLKIGSAAPDFTALTENGKTVRLSELRGKSPVILVFYPGDNTPVCTAQLCSLRDHWAAVRTKGAAVFGVNPGDAASHTRFTAEHRFPFPLFVDTDQKIAHLYGCDSPIGMVNRTVYVIGKDGSVLWARRGNPAPSEILAALP